jgi:hypothetical protein
MRSSRMIQAVDAHARSEPGRRGLAHQERRLRRAIRSNVVDRDAGPLRTKPPNRSAASRDGKRNLLAIDLRAQIAA